MTMAKKERIKSSAPMPLTQYENLSLEQLRLSSMNPRKTYNETALQELADSIKRQGLLQPITVRPIVDCQTVDGLQIYEVVCGSRRLKALRINEAESAPCLVRVMTDAEALDAMIVENLQRRDVDPLEEAEAFNLLIAQGQSIADLALRFGKSERYVRDRCKLNELIPELREAFHQNKLPLSGAIMLARLPQERQAEFADDNSFAVDADWDDTDNVSISDVKDYIAEDLPHLDTAAFLSVPEESWNVKKEPRLCANCPLNSSCQLSLFPELAESAICGDPDCFQNKVDAFAYWLLDSHKKDFVSPENGVLSIGLAPDNAFVLISTKDSWDLGRLEPRQRALYDALLKKYSDKCLTLTHWNDGVRKPYQEGAELQKMIERRDVVKGISLLNLVKGQFKDFEWFTVPHVDKKTKEDEDEDKADGLVNDYRSLENQERNDISDAIFKMFSDMETERDDELQWWEKAIMAGALLCERWEDTPKLNGEKYAESIDDYIVWWENKTDFRQERESLITHFKGNYSRMKVLMSLMETIEPDAVKEAKAEVMQKIAERRSEIELELKELGYDTNGHRLTNNENTES